MEVPYKYPTKPEERSQFANGLSSDQNLPSIRITTIEMSSNCVAVALAVLLFGCFVVRQEGRVYPIIP